MYVPPMLIELWGRVLRLIRILRSNEAAEYHMLPMNNPTRLRSWSEVVDDLGQQLWREQARVQRRDATIAELRDENERLNKRLSQHRKETRRSRREADEVRVELDEGRAATRLLRRDLEAQAKLLQVRGTELREAQAYSNNVDTVSHTDVLRVLDALNAEIFQFAAQAADGLEIVHAPPREAAVRATEKVIGRGMVEVLTAVSQGRCEHIGVQIALQAASVQVACDIVDSWSANREQNIALQEIHWTIFATGMRPSWSLVVRVSSSRENDQKRKASRRSGKRLPCTTGLIFNGSMKIRVIGFPRSLSM